MDLLEQLAALDDPHHLIGPCRIRFDLGPQGMAAVLCACGAAPRDDAAHARHVAHRRATGCDCGSLCPHEPPKESA